MNPKERGLPLFRDLVVCSLLGRKSLISFIEMMCVAVEVVDDIVDLTHYSVSGLGCMVSLSSRREGPALGGRKMCSKIAPENKNNNDLYRPWKKLGNEESLPRIVGFWWLILLLTPLTSLWLISFASFLQKKS